MLYRVDERWIHWRDNLYVPERFRAIVTDPRLPLAVLDISIEQGRLAFDRISFARSPGGPPLQSRDIRRSVDGLKREAATVVAAELRVVDGSGQLVRREETLDAFLTSYDQVARERGRGAKLEDDFLRKVAATYREALAGASPRSPMKHIQQQHQGSRSSANRWVKAARERGFLDGEEN